MSGKNGKLENEIQIIGIVIASALTITSMLLRPGVSAETKDPVASARAFSAAYKVFMHPRCMNCHPVGDSPLVGDESKIHPMSVKRGPGGMGQNGLWCSSCHQDKNLPGAHTPPGAPGWQLPTADMPMVFQNRTARQLCEQMKDPAQNGQRSPREVLEHVRTAPLVLWGWHPGDGRTPVPVSHEDFVKTMTEWVDNGASCPE